MLLSAGSALFEGPAIIFLITGRIFPFYLLSNRPEVFPIFILYIICFTLLLSSNSSVT
jgi:hypothetical protein